MPTPIPYVAQPIKEMGHKAVDILVEEIETQKNTMVEIKLSTELVTH